MAVKIRNNSNNGWQSAATIKIRNNANNGWHTVNTGKIWTGSAWSKFYQRITTTAPTVSATTVTKNAITWTVTQASTLQFAEFPSQFQYYIVYPSGLRSPSTGYSYTDARVATVSVTGLFQNQTVSLYYRLMYEDDTVGDNSDNTYYPEDETYALKETTTTATVVENPTVTGAGSIGPGYVSFTVDYHEADSYNWYLYRNSDSQFVSSGTNETNGNLSNRSVPYQDTQYRLYVRANYETDFSPNEYTYANGYQTSDAVVALSPYVTASGVTSFSITWNVNRRGANYYEWYLYKNNTGSAFPYDQTSVETQFTTAGLLANTSYTLRVISHFTDYGADAYAIVDTTQVTTSAVPTDPTITRTARGFNYITFNYTLYGDIVYYQVGTTPGGTDIANTSSTTGGDISFTDLTPSTSATTYYTRARNYSYDGGYSAWTSFSDTTIGFTAPSVSFSSQGTSPYGKTLTWNVNRGSGATLSIDLRRGSTSVDTGTLTADGTYSFGPVTTGATYTLFYRARVTNLSNPDFWAPTYAVGTYVNWPGSSRTVT
jgi:hypothetical protein